MASPAVIATDVLAIQIVGSLYAQTTITTFHWRINSLVGPATLTDVLNAMVTPLVGEFRDLCSNQWTATLLRGRRVTPNPTRSYEVAVVGGAGTVVSESLPPSVSGVISRFTNSALRTGRGRIFVPAVPEIWHENGQLTAAGVAAYQGFSPILDLPMAVPFVGEFDPVLFRRPNTAVNVEGTAVRSILRSQRRREIGVGI